MSDKSKTLLSNHGNAELNNVPDSFNTPTKSEDSPANLKLDPQRQWEGLQTPIQHYWEAPDTWVTVLTPPQILSAPIRLCLGRNAVPSEETRNKNKCANSRFTREILDRVRHQGAIARVGNYRWISSGQKPVQQTLKKCQVPAQERRGESVCHQWLGLKIVLQIYHSSTLANDI